MALTPQGHPCFCAWPDAPERPEKAYYNAAADGQFGTILRVYREWQVSGDTGWLKKMWPDVKKSLDCASIAWDADGVNPYTKVDAGKRDGMMTLWQHNTLDLDLAGWNTFCGSMYQAALLAGEKMAVAAGDHEAAWEYRRLFESARELTDRHLFNGEYYQQQESVTAPRQYEYGSPLSHDLLVHLQMTGPASTGLGYDAAAAEGWGHRLPSSQDRARQHVHAGIQLQHPMALFQAAEHAP